jgi:hypothetical protein
LKAVCVGGGLSGRWKRLAAKCGVWNQRRIQGCKENKNKNKPNKND